MPSSPNYVRDYKQEDKTRKQRGENVDDAKRHKLRRLAIKRGVVRNRDGKDLAHKRAMSKGGAMRLSNVTPQSPSENRSFARNRDGSLKSETSKREFGARRKSKK